MFLEVFLAYFLIIFTCSFFYIKYLIDFDVERMITLFDLNYCGFFYMLKKESVDAIAELKTLFADSHPCLIPDETGVDVLHVIELKKPLSTGMKVIDQELPRGIENGQVIEIRGRPSTGKVFYFKR